MLKNNKKTKFNANRSYSEFWMGNGSRTETFSGLREGMTASSDIVKLIKLANYQKAISNFVKIVTKKEIPVKFEGSNSHTNGKQITITSNIKEDNFDVVVGLSLHEASHILLSDFKIVESIVNSTNDEVNAYVAQWQVKGVPFADNRATALRRVKGMLNWIEDRRIDNFIFKTSPGYKAYYHKMYDHYWNSDFVLKALQSSSYTNPLKYDHWEMHIINMLSSSFRAKALPGLSNIVALIDLPNISRLQSSQDSLTLALQVMNIIAEVQTTTPPPPKQDKTESEDEEDNDTTQDDEFMETIEQQVRVASSQPEMKEEQDKDDNKEGGIDWDTDNKGKEELSAADKYSADKDLEKQKEFLQDGADDKRAADARMEKKLEQLAKESIELQAVGDKQTGTFQTLVYNYTNPAKFGAVLDLTAQYDKLRHEMNSLPYGPARGKVQDQLNDIKAMLDANGMADYFGTTTNANHKFVTEGLEMGALLGKKLQLHNESRERVDTRLRSGKIDAKRLAHAGYGIEGIFKQISIDKHKNAVLRISLDGSGSMSSGHKWESAVKMTLAIAKAATYTTGIRIQVDIRATHKSGSRSRGKDAPVILDIYDSKLSNINHLVNVLSNYACNSVTPEGLCFEAMIKKNLIITPSESTDSYFLNISDGEPYCASYSGDKALNHTRDQINKLRQDGIQVISFYLTSCAMSTSFEQLQKDNNAWLINNKINTSADLQAYNLAKATQSFNMSGSGANFRKMYGKDATVVDSSNTIQIAKELNKKFLAAKI